MKKLIKLIKPKEKVQIAASEKKAYSKAEKKTASSSKKEKSIHPKDLFWDDDYSDIGYC